MSKNYYTNPYGPIGSVISGAALLDLIKVGIVVPEKVIDDGRFVDIDAIDKNDAFAVTCTPGSGSVSFLCVTGRRFQIMTMQPPHADSVPSFHEA